MKQYPKQLQEQYKQVDPSLLNTNPSIYLNETKGGLNGQNMPVSSLSHSKFTAPTKNTTTSSKSITTEFIGATQQYKSVSRYAKDFAANNFTLLVAFNLKTEDWNKGWNRLEDLTNFDELVCSLDCKEGMLNGFAQINFRHGSNVVVSGGSYFETGLDWWTRWGVFLNDVLIAETGNCFPRLENLVIPFSIPVGSQNIRIDLRWKTITTNALNVSGYTADPTTDLEIFGAEIIARNTYR